MRNLNSKLWSVLAALAFLTIGTADAQSIRDGGISGVGPVLGSQTLIVTGKDWITCTPAVTVPGGTVPQYTVNSCRYTIIGKKVFIDVRLSGDGGAEAAGAVPLLIAAPVTMGASALTITKPCGNYTNGAVISLLRCVQVASATTINFTYQATLTTTATLNGDDQNNTVRTIQFSWDYEID